MPRPIQAHIDQNALANNLHVVRRATRSRIMAAIKGDGYGHGLLRVAEAFAAADGFAVLDIRDAITLREAGYTQTLLLLEGCFQAGEMQLAAEYDLSCVIHSARQIAMLDAYPKRGNLDVWLKVNSGMNRLGFVPEAVPAAMEKIRAHQAVQGITLMTHFASADEARGVSEQVAVFNNVAGAYRVPRSLANSAALLRYPDTHGDWVRPGIMLYGASPFADKTAREIGLRPAMTLHSEIIATQELNAGDEVGYGALFRADRAMRIGIVACGYADGYPRHATTGTPIFVEGKITRTVGRVSMDMLAVDLSDVPHADIGSRVVLWGAGLPVEEVARAAGTISYELLCGLTKRVPIYL
ncbi:MAG: alanine racemase [Gallionella sp.]